MEKMTGKSADILSENIERIRQLFPEVFVEGKIDFDMLQKVLRDNIETEKEHYGFTWHGKSDAIKLALKPTTGTLRPKKADSKHWDTTQNLFIEGDNLEVLRALQESYRGKIKMIYIDPPYNKGKDFVYEDDFSDNIRNYKEKVGSLMQANAETSGRYHTNWLNMMYPRLRLAKNLLKGDGVIFISIDDNEVVNLKKICDEIFGEENFMGQMVWHARGRSKTPLSIDHEYILVYARNLLNIIPIFDAKEENPNWYGENVTRYYSNPDNDPRGDWRDAQHTVTKKKAHYTYSINSSNGEVILGKVINDGIYYGHEFWMYPPETIKKLYDDNRLYFKLDKKRKLCLKVKKFRDEEVEISSLSGLIERTDISSRHGSEEFDELLGAGIFDYPKPTALIKKLLTAASKGTDIILDFFAGSATTAHSVIMLNAEDGGSRKYIMVQIPEQISDESEAKMVGYQNIAEIAKERIHRAGEIIKHKANAKFDTPTPTKDRNTKSVLPLDQKIKDLDIGFKVFELDETNFTIWDPNTKDIKQSLFEQLAPLKSDRTDEDAVYEILLKYGIDLVTPIEELELAGKKVYSLADGFLLICLEKEIGLETVKEMAKLSPERVVFYDDGFLDDTVKANAEHTLKKAGVDEIMVI